MPIVTTFNKDKWEETSKSIVYEWLTDDDCFQDPANSYVKVTTRKTTVRSGIIIPRCEYRYINITNTITGAGAQKVNAVFRRVVCELSLLVSRSSEDRGGNAEYALMQRCDVLDKYFRSSKGRPELGKAGLRKAVLQGPYPVDDKLFFRRNWLLSFEIEVV